MSSHAEEYAAAVRAAEAAYTAAYQDARADFDSALAALEGRLAEVLAPAQAERDAALAAALATYQVAEGISGEPPAPDNTEGGRVAESAVVEIVEGK